MSDITQLLASIGGALSAQGTGNLREFMATLAQQQAQQSDQDFKREQQTREQLFTISRDRAQRAHQKKLQSRQLAAEGKRGKQERYEAEAKALFNVAVANESFRAPIEKHLRKIVPSLTVEGEAVPLNWDDAGQVLPFLELAAESGFGSRLAGELVAREESDQAAMAAMLGTPAGPTGAPSRGTTPGAQQGPPSAPSVVATRQQYATAEGKLGSFTGQARLLEDALKQLEGSANDIPLDEYYNRSKTLAERLQTTAAEFEQYTSTPGVNRFFAEGAGLAAAAAGFRDSLRALGDSLYNAQRSKGTSALVEWTPNSPDTHPIFTQGFGGGPNESGEASWMLASPQQKVFNAAWQERADALRQLSDLDAEALPESDQKLRERLIEYASGEGNTLELGAMLSRMRTDALSPGSGMAVFNELSGLISGAHNFDIADMRVRLARAGANRTALKTLSSVERRIAADPAFGAELFGSTEAMEKALLAHGTLDTNGNLTVGDPAEFLSAYIQSDVGLERITNTLLDNLYGAEELSPLTAADAYEQVLERGTHLLKNSFGVTSGPTLSAFQRNVQRRLGNTQAVFETAHATPELHSWDGTAFHRATKVKSSRYGYADQLSPKAKKEYAQSADAFVFSGREGDVALVFKGAQQRFPGSYKQPQAWMVSEGRFRGEEKRLTFPEREQDVAAEIGSNYLFRDLFDVFRANSDVFASVTQNYGRVADQARVGKPFGSQAKYTTFAPWARGRQNFLFGNDSFATKYQTQVAPEDRDENTLNALGFFDLMRALKIEDDRTMNADAHRLLSGLQTQLRDMSYAQALSAIGTKGTPAEGFAVDPAAVTKPLYTPALPAAVQALNVEQELALIKRANGELARSLPGQYVDVLPGLAAEYAVLDETRLAAAQAELGEAEATLKQMQAVRASGALEAITPFIDEALRAAPFTNPTELSALLESVSPLIASETSDPMQLGTTSVQSAIQMVGNAKSLSSAIDLTFNLIAEHAANRAATLGAGLPQVVPAAERRIALKEFEQMVGEYRFWLHAARDAILKRSAAGENLLGQVPVTVLTELENTDFAEILSKKNLTVDDASRAALYAFLAKTKLEQ